MLCLYSSHSTQLSKRRSNHLSNLFKLLTSSLLISQVLLCAFAQNQAWNRRRNHFIMFCKTLTNPPGYLKLHFHVGERIMSNHYNITIISILHSHDQWKPTKWGIKTNNILLKRLKLDNLDNPRDKSNVTIAIKNHRRLWSYSSPWAHVYVRLFASRIPQ